jgi:hypothetical protein
MLKVESQFLKKYRYCIWIVHYLPLKLNKQGQIPGTTTLNFSATRYWMYKSAFPRETKNVSSFSSWKKKLHQWLKNLKKNTVISALHLEQTNFLNLNTWWSVKCIIHLHIQNAACLVVCRCWRTKSTRSGAHIDSGLFWMSWPKVFF